MSPDSSWWLSPEDADEQEWENTFITAIHDRERWYTEWEPPYSWDVEDILQERYRKDPNYREVFHDTPGDRSASTFATV